MRSGRAASGPWPSAPPRSLRDEAGGPRGWRVRVAAPWPVPVGRRPGQARRDRGWASSSTPRNRPGEKKGVFVREEPYLWAPPCSWTGGERVPAPPRSAPTERLSSSGGAGWGAREQPRERWEANQRWLAPAPGRAGRRTGLTDGELPQDGGGGRRAAVLGGVGAAGRVARCCEGPASGSSVGGLRELQRAGGEEARAGRRVVVALAVLHLVPGDPRVRPGLNSLDTITPRLLASSRRGHDRTEVVTIEPGQKRVVTGHGALD
jgi:hypothetical protein